jgi:hypothetical protein
MWPSGSKLVSNSRPRLRGYKREYVFGQEAALTALECLTKLVRDSIAKNERAVDEQRRSMRALENAQPVSGAIH